MREMAYKALIFGILLTIAIIMAIVDSPPSIPIGGLLGLLMALPYVFSFLLFWKEHEENE